MCLCSSRTNILVDLIGALVVVQRTHACMCTARQRHAVVFREPRQHRLTHVSNTHKLSLSYIWSSYHPPLQDDSRKEFKHHEACAPGINCVFDLAASARLPPHLPSSNLLCPYLPPPFLVPHRHIYIYTYTSIYL